MNSKAIRKQLLAAVAMVLVAAVALGSSTYAWFVASGTVTAEGMSVKVQSEGGLAISVDGTAWGTTADAGIEEEMLKPASTLDLTEWYYATALDPSAPAGDNAQRSDITGTVATVTKAEGAAFNTVNSIKASNGYVAGKEFQIRSTSASAVSKGLYVSDVIVTGAAHQLSTALRVGVLYQSGSTSKGFIYGPVDINPEGQSLAANKASDNYSVYKTTSTEWGKVKLREVGQGDFATTTKSTILADTVSIPADSDSAVKVKVFVWYEGEDQNLYSNRYNLDYAQPNGIDTLDVTVKFSSILSGNEAAGG